MQEENLWKLAASSIEPEPTHDPNECGYIDGKPAYQTYPQFWQHNGTKWFLRPYGACECLKLMKRLVGTDFRHSLELFSDVLVLATYDDIPVIDYEGAKITRFALPLEDAVLQAYVKAFGLKP